MFESGQHPIIVGQAAYNSAYGTNFAASEQLQRPEQHRHKCDGFVRVNDTRHLRVQHAQGADHQDDDARSAQGHPRRDELGDLRRVRPDDGQPRHRGAAADPGPQNVMLYPYVNPATELIDATNLPKQT